MTRGLSPGGQSGLNIANGDLFRWREPWPKLAAWFDLKTARPLPMALADVTADKAPLWDTMVAEHGLVATRYADLSSWAFADFVFSWDYDVFADCSKARRACFHCYVRTERMFIDLFEQLRTARIIP